MYTEKNKGFKIINNVDTNIKRNDHLNNLGTILSIKFYLIAA